MYLVAAIVNIVITIFLAKQFGCIGAAAATAITLFVVSDMLVNFYYARSCKLDMKQFWVRAARMIVPLVPLGLVAAIAWSFISGALSVGWVELIIGIVVYTLIFGVYAYILSADSYERDLVKGAFARFGTR